MYEVVESKANEERTQSVVRCFDNVKLENSGEYFIRGIVESSIGAGLYEPYQNRNDFLTATGLVEINYRNLIPIRIWTTEDKVRLTKGMVIGTFQTLKTNEQSESMNDVALITKEQNQE